MPDIMNIDKYDNLFKHLDNRIRNNISLESVTKTDIYDKQMIEVCWSYFIFYIGMKKQFFFKEKAMNLGLVTSLLGIPH